MKVVEIHRKLTNRFSHWWQEYPLKSFPKHYQDQTSARISQSTTWYGSQFTGWIISHIYFTTWCLNPATLDLGRWSHAQKKISEMWSQARTDWLSLTRLMLPWLMMTPPWGSLYRTWLEAGATPLRWGAEWGTGIPLPGQATSYGPQEVEPIASLHNFTSGGSLAEDVQPSGCAKSTSAIRRRRTEESSEEEESPRMSTARKFQRPKYSKFNFVSAYFLQLSLLPLSLFLALSLSPTKQYK